MVKHTDLSSSPLISLPGASQRFAQSTSRRREDRSFDIGQAVARLHRRFGLVIACILAGVALSFAAAFLPGPTYTATALISVAEGDDNASSRATDAAVDTQIAMLQSPIFIERAFNALSLDDHLKQAVSRVSDFERRLKVMQQLRSRLIAISFSAKSPTAAAEVANLIARLYVEDPFLQSVESVDDSSRKLSLRIQELSDEIQRAADEAAPNKGGLASPASTERIQSLKDQMSSLQLSQALVQRRMENREHTLAMTPPVQLIALATPPTRRSSINPALIMIPGAIFSAIFGIASALLLGALDKRIYSISDLTANIDVPFVGGIPARLRRSFFGAPKSSDIQRGYTRAVEAIVTRTLLLQSRPRRVLLVTSSDIGDKAPEFARILAAAAARLGRRVLLVELDMTGPRKDCETEVSESDPSRQRDIVDVLANFSRPASAIRRVIESDLHILPLSEDRDCDSFALVASGRLKHLLDELRVDYDWIVVAGPPVIGVNETRIIATAVDAALLIVRSGVSKLPDVREALDAIAESMSLAGVSDVDRLAAVLIDAPKSDLPKWLRDVRAISPPRPAFVPDFGEAQAREPDGGGKPDVNRIVARNGSSS